MREQGTERVSGASELAKGRASGPVLQSGFLVILHHGGIEREIDSWELDS